MPSWAERKELGHKPSLADSKAQQAFNCWFSRQDREADGSARQGFAVAGQEASRGPRGEQDKAGPSLLREAQTHLQPQWQRGPLWIHSTPAWLNFKILSFWGVGMGSSEVIVYLHDSVSD